MPPFSAKPVCMFLLRITLLLVAVFAIFYYLFHTSGHPSIKPSTHSPSSTLASPAGSGHCS